jgi:hypothetical protein
MDLRIEKLLKKYWAGETTPEEEKTLKSFFQEIPSGHKEAEYFNYLSASRKRQPDVAFSHPGRKIRTYWLSAAAAIVILFVVGMFTFQYEPAPKYAVEDPAKALEITRNSLRMVSEGLNKGKTYSSEINKINKAKEIVK